MESARPILPSNIRRVAIDLNLDSSSPNYAKELQLTDPPIRQNYADVVLTQTDVYPTDNAWLTNEPIDYDIIQFWNRDPIDLDLQRLLRIKICNVRQQLSPKAQHDLLRCLMKSALQELHLDQLDVIENRTLDLNFSALRTLSIGEILVVGEQGQLKPISNSTVRLVAPELATVYAGKTSFDYLQFVNCSRLHRLILPGVPMTDRLADASFSSLRVLECQGIFLYHHDVDVFRYQLALNSAVAVILRIARADFLPDLQELHCGHDYDAASYQLSGGERIQIREIYEQLEQLVRRDQLNPNLRIYIQSLRFEPGRLFNSCGFQMAQIQFHALNILAGHEVQPSPRVTKVNYRQAMELFFPEPEDRVFGGPPNQFFTVYPNLRTLIVNTYGQPIAQTELLGFLRHCRCLTTLELYWLDFEPDFYAGLPELASLQALHTLVIFERPPTVQRRGYEHHIDFDPILTQFAHCQKLHTNLITWPAMRPLVRKLSFNHCLVADFGVFNDYYTRIKIVRCGQYEMDVRIHRYGDGFFLVKSRQSFIELEHLEENLDELNPALYAHWQDDEPLKCIRSQMIGQALQERKAGEDQPSPTLRDWKRVQKYVRQQRELPQELPDDPTQFDDSKNKTP